MTIRLAAALTALLAPAAAFAHGGPAGHSHPHGIETVALAALAVVAIWAVRRASR